MAQMTVPAEPSYRTTSYDGLKGADFSNDPSLVARNHSPDLLNMVSDNGGSPIKRKGWEVTDTVDGTVKNIWHFQMFGKVWHIAVWTETGKSHVAEITSNGTIRNLLTVNTEYEGKGVGYFFNSGDSNKTGFYLIYGDRLSRIRPTNESANTLSYSYVTPTNPVVRELSNPDGSGGVTKDPINLLTREMTFMFVDDSNNNERFYRCFAKGSEAEINAGLLSVIQVQLLDTNGIWQTIDDWEFRPNSSTRGIYITTPLLVKSTTENVVKISLFATGGDSNSGKILGNTCSTVYSQMSTGQVFLSGNPDYPQYVWYSELNDPTYFPDTNYLFVGGAGTKVKGMIPFGSQIAVLKEPSVTESTIFMVNYTTATDQKTDANGDTYTETRDVYQVKHGFTGIGSLSADTVLSLGDEPLFLSQNGIMGMVSNSINSSNSVKNRSGFLDPRLLEETNLSNAIATVHKNYYILVLNGHAYLLDARQKTNDSRGNTSYIYESYYWDNIPATAIASDGETLWFGTADGRICRFKNSNRMSDYSDNSHYGDDPIRAYVKEGETALSPTWFVDSSGDAITPDASEKYIIMGGVDTDGNITKEYDDGTYQKYDVFSYDSDNSVYALAYTELPISAVWSTPLDNDGATNYFKTLQKKGSGCTLYPFTRSSVDAYLVKDLNAEVYIGSITIDIDNWEDIDFERFTFIASKAPRDMFFRKKMKKYKRLKIILKNEQLDEGFGVQEIFKTYLMTRYAK